MTVDLGIVVKTPLLIMEMSTRKFPKEIAEGDSKKICQMKLFEGDFEADLC